MKTLIAALAVAAAVVSASALAAPATKASAPVAAVPAVKVSGSTVVNTQPVVSASAASAVQLGQAKNIASGTNGNATGIVGGNGQGADRHQGFGYGFEKRNVSPP